MKPSLRQVAGLLLAALAVSACTESSRPVATGEGSIRGIHALVEAPEVNFLIEERSLGNLTYKQGVGFVDYDDLEYTFNFDTFPFSDEPARRLASTSIDVIADTSYSMVLTGTLDNPSIMMWEEPEADFDGIPALKLTSPAAPGPLT